MFEHVGVRRNLAEQESSVEHSVNRVEQSEHGGAEQSRTEQNRAGQSMLEQSGACQSRVEQERWSTAEHRVASQNMSEYGGDSGGEELSRAQWSRVEHVRSGRSIVEQQQTCQSRAGQYSSGVGR